MEEKLQSFFRQLDAYYEVHDNDGAERYMKEQANLPLTEASGSEEEKQAAFSDSCLYSASVYNELACFYRGVSRFQESVDTFETARQMLKAAGKEDTDLYGTVLLNEAGVWRYLGETEEALGLFEEAEEMLTRPGSEGNEETLAGLWNNTGLVHLDRNEPSLALPYFRRALEVVSASERMAVQQGVTWNNIASVFMMQGDIPHAEEAVRKAVDLLQEYGSKEDPHTPAALNTLGVIYYHQGKKEEALLQFQRSLALTKLCYGENAEYASGCANCAAVCDALGRKDEAAAWQQKADSIRGTK